VMIAFTFMRDVKRPGGIMIAIRESSELLSSRFHELGLP
jgi:hypothetical protein